MRERLFEEVFEHVLIPMTTQTFLKAEEEELILEEAPPVASERCRLKRDLENTHILIKALQKLVPDAQLVETKPKFAFTFGASGSGFGKKS